MMVYRLPLTKIHALNVAVQLAFDFALVKLAGPKALAYLILSSFLAGSLHPCAGHFIAEHYVFSRPEPASASAVASSKPSGTTGSGASNVDPLTPIPETYSYYGPLNLLTYNVGLHNEHHDFPAIPWTRLPVLRRVAKEFYDELPSHQSWVYVLWQFIWDPKVGLWCRVKRKEGGRLVGGGSGAAGWREEELGANEKGGIVGVR